MRAVLNQVLVWGRLIKFSHTVFALPFALSVLVILWERVQVTPAEMLWILVSLVSARTSAMSFNRLLDREIDSQNPRTASRELPSGQISALSVGLLCAMSSIIFMGSAAALGLHCLRVSPIVLAILLFYSWTKRFTSYSHLVLGLCLAMAPGGVWYALTARFDPEPLYLMAAVLLWVGGFDIIYACQDIDFDRTVGLYSLPAKFGMTRALAISRLFHLLALVGLVLFGYVLGLGSIYYLGCVIFALLLISQHVLVGNGDLTKVDLAFFTRNGIASLVYLLSVILDRTF